MFEDSSLMMLQQVYQGMDIGTAKLCPESTTVPHHLLNIVPVTHSYAAGEFRKDAIKAIEVEELLH